MSARTERFWPEGSWPTAQQLADWLVVCTDGERLTHTEIVLHDAQRLERLEREVDDAWSTAAVRRGEARRYYVAWQVARMRAHALRKAMTP